MWLLYDFCCRSLQSLFRDADFALGKLDDYARLEVVLGKLDDKQLILL
jgi:hypothetical protein